MHEDVGAVIDRVEAVPFSALKHWTVPVAIQEPFQDRICAAHARKVGTASVDDRLHGGGASPLHGRRLVEGALGNPAPGWQPSSTASGSTGCGEDGAHLLASVGKHLLGVDETVSLMV
ncbi:hypothetical protein PO587_43515 [Streptomyces gilvifuscus]|uniref:Uncharacterized protein n=1 Tax=Streptomyces gilvifuscus TaxID=1550617 RepID=A0ABT5G997_9ACTN|nr:hypothetical protein [Streptomyces gilvifuscus]MDC2961315.1 hypothetical protein [Streptomyces gilvifuscus]